MCYLLIDGQLCGTFRSLILQESTLSNIKYNHYRTYSRSDEVKHKSTICKQKKQHICVPFRLVQADNI